MSDKQGAPILPPLNRGAANNGGNNGSTAQQTVNLQQVLATAQGLNVLATTSGQQFVITTQVSGLTQVIPNNATTNTSGTQVGVTRIVNIAGTPPRNAVGGIGIANTLSHSSPAVSRPQNSTKLMLTTSPKLVQVQSPSSPARKRLKLSETMEKPISYDANGYRKRIIEHKIRRMRSIREKYAENASELFFLHASGNIMDYHTWRKRSPTPQFINFLHQHRLDPDDNDEDLTMPLSTIPEFLQLPTTTVATTMTVTSAIVTTTTAVTTVTSGSTVVQIPNQRSEVRIVGTGVTPVAVSSTLPVATLAQLTHQGGTSVVADSSKLTTTVANPVVEKSPSITTPKMPTTVTLNSPQPVVKLIKLSTPTTITTSCDTTNNQEQIVEKAKQEAYVMQRIAELQREGLWSERRLPKVQEPTRIKAHWDYLLEEMVWLAADFAQERKWKKAAAKKCARMVQKYFQEKAIQAQKAEKSQELRLKKIASLVAKEIKTFWANVEKLVEYKQQTRLEEKRKKALDQHLNFIVGQTEKYSTWLTEGLNKTEGPQSVPASMNSSRISSPIPLEKCHSDEEFQPNQSSDDDEETIAKAEEEMKLTTNHKEEVELLKRESEIPLEDLLKDLPPDYLEDCNKSLSPQNVTNEEKQNENEEVIDVDTDFVVASGESSDEEDTIMEEERLEGEIDHKRELDELKADNEMSIDELTAKYANISDILIDVDDEDEDTDKESSDKEVQVIEDQITSNESENEENDHDSDEEEAQTQSDTEADVGLQSLLEDPSAERQLNTSVTEDDHSDAHNEMDNVAALAESIQPKGNTLLTTSVVTKIPFLLKHSLREYQHIGLDWLVTMYDRKLNGILADEMGLGKTIQTIALLAHLACEKGNWGPHLIIVPTSVMLNWEMECKKWCPGFKILTYYGTQKERKQKRTGWTKPNAFHICITSYKLVIQDHQSFRRKKWKYLILDEAQNIKNFKSQRWQLLLNFQTQRRLLLTGTPLQNNLMELWSLMHFLMPNVFQSHREFKEWFSNPVTGMIEGNSEYNENIIRRLHKVLRPFLLRRLKTEVEKQLPKKYEHVIMCRLSKRQRFLYDDFMSRAKTKETLASGNLLSVINVLMQLRKVCNHPNLFEVRPTVSPFQMEAIEFVTSSLIWSALDYDPFKHIQLSSLNLLLLNLETMLSAFVAHRMNRLRTPKKLIEEIDNQPEPAPRCPSGRIKINVRLSNQAKPQQQQQHIQTRLKNLAGVLPTPRVGVTLRVAGGQQLQGYSLQLVPHQGSVKAIPVATLGHNPQNTTVTSTMAATNAQRITVGNASIRDGIQRLTTQTVTVKQGDSVQRIAVPSFAQLVQTSTGRHFILTPSQQNTNTVSFPVMTSSGPRFTVLSKSLMGLSTSGATTVNKVVSGVVTTPSGRPVMRVPPLNVTSQSSPNGNNGQQTANQQQSQSIRSIITRQAQKEIMKTQNKEHPKSEFHLTQLEEERRQRRQAKLQLLANINERRCAACPLYGEDLFTALRIGKPTTVCRWHNGWVHCVVTEKKIRTRKEFFSRTEALAEAIRSTEQIVEELKEVFERYVVYVPAVCASVPRFHVSHPPPHKLWGEHRLWTELQRQLSPKLSLFHPISSLMLTQFPDPRLIQYDCGKLQSLDRLLRKLKSENHRVLIFTQMTRMLDVLEAFLNFHGHIYLRLDGTTRVDQRQVLMERFNGDKRIFCFILSTRSGGVGVNLTGADTVIFYDSDWNPTMDAQAQDRCHRIGQTRDVHIYRLISEKTVEENILKKANQKRLLGDLAIEGGNFTTAYFKSSTIQDLFNIDQTENDASTRMAEVLEQNRDREKAWNKDMVAGSFQSNFSGQHMEEKTAMGALESALAAAEEDLDVQAAKTAKAEAVADLAEFDENIPLEEADKDDVQVSKAEQEVQNLIAQLTPIERYAMKFVEESEGAFSAAQLAAAERELEEQKKEWELDRLRALREEEERRMRLADDDEKPLTFGREDAQNQVNSTAAKSGSRRLVSKKLMVPSRRSLRRRDGSRKRRARELSESENETTSTESDSDSESQDEDVVEDSLDEESSHTESQSQGDEEEEGESGEGSGEKEEGDKEKKETGERNEDGRANNRHNSERRDFSKRKGRLANSGSCSRNHFDLNSPRTRSRGNVEIDLWTLDVSPILPGIKPNFRRQPKKFHRAKSEETVSLPSSVDMCRKRSGRVNTNIKISGNFDQNIKTEMMETDGSSPKDKRDSKKNDRDLASSLIDSNELEQCVTDSNMEQSVDDRVDSTTSIVKTQSNQMKTSELVFDDVDDQNVKIEKDRNDEKITNGTNLITVCSVQVTRCSHKMLSTTYKKLESEVNRNEDTENLDVNISPTNSRSPPNTVLQLDASLKHSKEMLTKSRIEFGASANSLCNNMRGKLTVVASKESDRSVESSSSRSVSLLRSKTLRNGSPDAADIVSKSVAISRISTVQRNSKTNVNTDEVCGNAVEDKNKNNCDEANNDVESAISLMQKSSQKFKSENLSASQIMEKETSDTTSNMPDFLTSLTKNELNSHEPKCKMRKIESIQRGVTTRSSKILSTVNHLEESNARLVNDKIDLLSENKSSSQTKTQTRKIDKQHPVAEQSRITRSTSHSWTLPPPPLPVNSDEMTMPSKLTSRRRPDTPLPRPITRSLATVNFPARIDAVLPNRIEKHTTRNSKQYQDNGLLSPPMPFRRSGSIPPMKPDSKESPAIVVVSAKCRPDTPRPNISSPSHNNEQISRVTRSGLLFNSALSAKSTSSPSSPTSAFRTSVKHMRASSMSSESENTASLISPSYEKPQRTAKVVAILTLDTRNNSNKTSSSSQSRFNINCETKIQDKELFTSRLLDSLKEQEIDHESCNSSDIKSRKLRRETKRIKTVSNSLEDEDGSNDISDEDPSQKRSRSLQISSSSSSATTAMTRSEKLKGTTIS